MKKKKMKIFMKLSPKKIALFLIIFLLAGYGLWQSREFLRGPRIFFEKPSEGEIVQGSILAVKGKAREVSRLTLNGYPIFINEAGEFEEERILAPGVNILELSGEDKFGHKKTIQRMVLMK